MAEDAVGHGTGGAAALLAPLLPGPAQSAPPAWGQLPFFQPGPGGAPSDWQRLHARLDQARKGGQIWQPSPQNIFRALTLTPRHKVRVVILGQDPYHTPGRAQGLAFAFPPSTPPRDSLRNILTELQNDLGVTRADGDLSGWAAEGVLLLNTLLTVPVGAANGHKGWGWEALTAQILAATAGDGPRAFVLWGGPAQKSCAKLPRDGHLFIESPHPSPLSVHRGFYGSKPFSRVNDWLAARGQPPVNWAA